MSLPSRFSVLSGIQLTRQCRIRDLFHTHDHVHKGSQVTGRSSSVAPIRRPCDVRRAGRDTSHGAGRLPSTVLRILLVVNSFASSVTARNTVVVHRRLSEAAQPDRRHAAATTSKWSRRTGAATPPDSPTTPHGAASTSSSDTEVTAPSTRSPPASPAPTPHSACCPADRRTSSPAHSACRTIPSQRSNSSSAGIDAERPPSDRTRPGQRPLLLLPHRRRLRRRGRPAGRTSRLAQAVARPSALHLRRADDLGPRVRPQAAALPGRRRRRRADIDDGYFTIVLNTNPYTYLGNRPLDLSPHADARPAARGASRSAR